MSGKIEIQQKDLNSISVIQPVTESPAVEKTVPTAPDQGKAGTADRSYLSNFWEAVRGEGGRLDIRDYICPRCHKNIYYMLWAATYCPHCNTPLFSAPRRKLDAKQFRNWQGDDIEGLRYFEVKRKQAPKKKLK